MTTPQDPDPGLSPADYRHPGTPSGSQWWTDDEAFGACLVYALLGLSVVGAVIGALIWVLSLIFW